MAIIRVLHDKDHPYKVFNIETCRPKMNNDALGLLLRCLSFPDNWTFYVTKLAEDSCCGVKAIYTQINKLIKSGYALRVTIQDKENNMKFIGNEYFFFESPKKPEEIDVFLEEIQKMFPNRLFGYAAKRHPEKSPLLIKNIKLNKENKNPPPPSYPENLDLPEEAASQDEEDFSDENKTLPEVEKPKAPDPKPEKVKPSNFQKPKPAAKKPEPSEASEKKIKLLEDFPLSPAEKRRICTYSEQEIERAAEIAKQLKPKKSYFHLLCDILIRPQNYDADIKNLTDVQKIALQLNEELRHNWPVMCSRNAETILSNQTMYIILPDLGKVQISLKNEPEATREIKESIEFIRRHKKPK